MITRTGTTPYRHRRALSALLALSTATGGLAAAGSTATARATPAPPSSLVWGDCPREDPPHPSPRAQCTTVQVPVDWAKPTGPKLSLFVARHRATDPARRIGVLMSNPGGPGNPGADDALRADDPYDGYAPAMLERFDMIGFDPRGVGRSEGARCDEDLAASVPNRPRNAAEFERMRTLNGELAASCLRQTGPLAAHMDTESVARDMDAIRAALGERRISFLGHSYGTLVGERYSRLFPDRLRALALDSAMDPDRPDAERYLTDGSTTTDDTLNRLAAWCKTDASCALKSKDVRTVVAKLYARADAGTLREPGPTGPTRARIDADRLTDHLTFALGRWSPETTAAELDALRTGKGEMRQFGSTVDLTGRLVLCRDYDFRLRDFAHYQAVRKRLAKAVRHVRYNSQALDTVLACQGWTLPPEPRPAQAKGTLPPVLVVNATHDLATPLPGARRMARAFPKASLRIVDTVAHWLYDKTSRQEIDAYLLRPKG
ncbi:alpha/beta hydrolase [Streptomyces sp. NPDC002490]|uniref:alpha/beta hydrolase n=1 Tax=Streptomyces sp. NPDC002490 TaxID=3154416 RepID=UPI00332F2B6C